MRKSFARAFEQGWIGIVRNDTEIFQNWKVYYNVFACI